MQNLFKAILIAFALFTANTARAEGLQLDFSSKTVATPLEKSSPDAGTPPPKSGQQDLHISLYPQSMAVTYGDETNIYDFKNRTYTVLNHAAKTVLETPLYAIPMFRLQERESRISIRQTLNAMKKDGEIDANLPAESEIDIDLVFGTDKTAKGTEPLVTRSTIGETVSFSSGDRKLASYQLSQTAIPSALASTYARFIRYTLIVHPVIARDIAARKQMVSTVSYNYRERADIQTTLSLQNTKPLSGEAAEIPANYRRIYAQNARLDAAIRKSMTAAKPSLADYKTKISGFMTQKRPAEAALVMMEMLLSYPDVATSDPDFTRLAIQTIVSDPVAKRILTLTKMAGTNDQDVKSQLDFAQGLADSYPEDGPIAGLFVANNIVEAFSRQNVLSRFQADTLAGMENVFLKTIEAKPTLAGAYRDLGNYYFTEFEVPSAWICWREAKRIDPMMNLQNITAMAARTAKAAPEFF